MRRLMATTAAVLSTAVLLTGCGSSSNPSSGSAGSSSGPKVIDVTFKGDSVTPHGDRVDVAVGQQVEFKVTADKAGEIHVHSTPEKELEYDAGTTDLTVGPFDTPGLIEVESHALDKTIVQLQVK